MINKNVLNVNANFETVNVKGDGHCLFRSIAICLDYLKNDKIGEMSDSRQLIVTNKLRKIASNIICNNGGDDVGIHMPISYKDLILNTLDDDFDKMYSIQIGKSDNKTNNERFRVYCKELRSGKLWGGEAEIIALSSYLKVPITVYNELQTGHVDVPKNYGRGIGYDIERIFLYRVNNNHFKPLLPRRGEENYSNNNNYNRSYNENGF